MRRCDGSTEFSRQHCEVLVIRTDFDPKQEHRQLTLQLGPAVLLNSKLESTISWLELTLVKSRILAGPGLSSECLGRVDGAVDNTGKYVVMLKFNLQELDEQLIACLSQGGLP